MKTLKKSVKTKFKKPLKMATKWGNSAAQKINLCPIKHCNN